ncbi:Co-chaperone Hsc20 [Leucogyrophana mollusca]|uniref:Co-chaperone Hsc20 n=1 Tax=Leucogyrophana mollusca TaxID=85980 RepID=A0ACB8BZ69_9AGAM|nr:Co-chaperone Hsc20 [Leucogyrophana mollusca]
MFRLSSIQALKPLWRRAPTGPRPQLAQPLQRLQRRNFSQPTSQHNIATSLSKTCPSCGTALPTPLPVCPTCRYIARIHPSISFHELFGLPYDPNPFIVDLVLLRRRFLEAQRVSHPDAWATKNDDLRDAALDVSNAVNTAYKTLLTPLHRVEYILRRQGIETEEADQLEDLDLITEVMEAREEIDSIQPGNIERLRSLEGENDAKVQDTMETIKGLIASKDWKEVKTAAVRLKYLQGIQDAIKQRVDNM